MGNAAVARMLEGGRVPQVTIQRKGKLAALLQKLAVSTVGEGQSIEVQKKLVVAIGGPR